MQVKFKHIINTSQLFMAMFIPKYIHTILKAIARVFDVIKALSVFKDKSL